MDLFPSLISCSKTLFTDSSMFALLLKLAVLRFLSRVSLALRCRLASVLHWLFLPVAAVRWNCSMLADSEALSWVLALPLLLLPFHLRSLLPSVVSPGCDFCLDIVSSHQLLLLYHSSECGLASSLS